MIALVFAPFVYLFATDNADFFEKAKQQRAQWYTWHYVGTTPPDPKAKAIPLQCVDQSGKVCGEPYILWKLKK